VGLALVFASLLYLEKTNLNSALGICPQQKNVGDDNVVIGCFLLAIGFLKVREG